MKLRILDYLDDIKEFNGEAISGKLRCTCGNHQFEFFHTGRQTKGILAPYIIRKNKQLILRAKCVCCGEIIDVYNSMIDGTNSKTQEESHDFIPFVIPKIEKDEFEVVIKYNYWIKQFKENGEYSNLFEECFIYIIENGKEGSALIEE